MGTHRLKELAFRLRRGLCRRLLPFTPNPRPDSLPFVSGDTFRAMADHIYENGREFRPEAVRAGAVIFVDVKMIDRYFAEAHPKIAAKYVLITHNGDRNIDAALAAKLDDRIAAWFAQNVAVRHDKIRPIPIGLENRYYCNNGLPRIFARLRRAATPKKNRILYGFTVATNPTERQPALDALSTCASADRLEGWPIPPEYARVLHGYKFVASPPGNGIDCIRTWEALLLRTVPIVKRNIMNEHFLGLGLPLVLIDDWRDLAAWDEKKLSEMYLALESGFDDPHTMFAPWRKMIEDAARAVGRR